MPNSRLYKCGVVAFFFLVSTFCASNVFGQSGIIDSLQNLVSIAEQDTHKVSLLISLSDALGGMDPRKSMKIAHNARTLAEKLGDTEGLAFANKQIGTLYRKGKEFDTAIVHLKESERLFGASGNVLNRAEVWMDIGICHYSLGRTRKSVEATGTSRSICRMLTSSADSLVVANARAGVLRSLHHTWVAYYFAGDFSEGLKVLLEAEGVASEFGLRKANLYNNFGINYRSMGKEDKALEYYFKGLAVAEGDTRWEDQARIHANISDIYSDRGDNTKARDHALQALNIIQTYCKDDTRLIAHAYFDLGNIETQEAHYAQALQHFLEALKLFEMANNGDELAYLLVEMSELYLLQSDPNNAVAHLRRALEAYRKIRNTVGESHVLFQLGKIAMDQGALNDALQYHTQSLSIRRHGERKIFIAQSLLERGNVFLHMALAEAGLNKGLPAASIGTVSPLVGSYLDSATSAYAQSTEIAGEMSDKSAIMKCSAGLGRVYMLRGDYAEAFSRFNTSRLLADSLHMRKDLYEAYASLAEAAARLQHYDEAYRYYQLYSALKDSVFNEASSKQLKEIQGKYDLERKDLEIKTLSQEKEIVSLKVRQHESALKEAELQSVRKESEIKLLNQRRELQQQQVINANRALSEKELESRVKSAELEAARKEQLLQEHHLEEQRLIMYGALLVALLTIALGAIIINRLKLRRELEKRQAVFDERRRVAGDLHDGLGQYFLVIMNRAKMMMRAPLPEGAATDLSEMITSASLGIEDVRHIAHALSRDHLEQTGLQSSVKEMLGRVLDPAGVHWELRADGVENVLAPETHIHVFRILQECVNNVVRHASASNVFVAMAVKGDAVVISVRDDGKGFEYKEAREDKATRGGFGLKGIRARAEILNGSLTVGSMIGCGTTTTVTIPLNGESPNA